MMGILDMGTSLSLDTGTSIFFSTLYDKAPQKHVRELHWHALWNTARTGHNLLAVQHRSQHDTKRWHQATITGLQMCRRSHSEGTPHNWEAMQANQETKHSTALLLHASRLVQCHAQVVCEILLTHNCCYTGQARIFINDCLCEHAPSRLATHCHRCGCPSCEKEQSS